MELLQTLASMIVTLGILVTIHEWGHFWVARRCGVKVLKFSVGFGKPIWQRTAADGCTYQVAAIPLGGYVAFLDEREGNVKPEERHLAFNNQPVLQRMAIVFAGPAVNLIFAVLAYWFLFAWGVDTVKPTIGAVEPTSLASRAQLEPNAVLTEIDGREVYSWDSVNLALANRLGDSGTLQITTELNGRSQITNIELDTWMIDLNQQSPLNALGIIPWQPVIPPVLGTIVEGGAAEAAGLQSGDVLQAVNGESVMDWGAFVTRVQASPNQALALEIERGGQMVDLTLTPRPRPDNEQIGYIGAGVESVSWPEDQKRNLQQPIGEAFVSGLVKTGQMIDLTLDSIGKIIVGVIGLDSLSGPITIAKVAGASAASGFEAFVSFLAYISISLGVLNLLPIPVLDGGHLVYHFVELVRGKPVSETIQLWGAKIGMVMLGAIMLLAVFNDLLRI